MLNLKARGLNAPKLGIGDGAMGFWAALEEVCPETLHQRCWMHKTGNVLNCMPKSIQPKVKSALHEIWQAETRADADKAFDLFIRTYKAKYPKATVILQKDREELLAFYDFPGPALAEPENNQSDRIDLWHHTSSDEVIQRMPDP